MAALKYCTVKHLEKGPRNAGSGVGGGGDVGGEGAGGSGHALAAFKDSLNTYKRV